MVTTQIKPSFLFYMFTLSMCLNSFFLGNSAAQVDTEPVPAPDGSNYTFETIDVPGVEFLELTASSDFGDYAGNTRSPDGEKIVGFTLIDGVFTTYDFPGSKNTFFYALSNTGIAAGHYQDRNGLYHGVVLKNGELRQYDFPGAAQTFIYGISDAARALTGNWIDASGVRRGFSGGETVEFPGASATYADFVNAIGRMVGSYVDAEGIYHPYARNPYGRFISLDLPNAAKLEYFFVHGINDARVVVARAKPVGDVPRTYVGTFQQGLQEFEFPGSVSTEGWNINQDGSIVGHYDSADGRRHGFIARPASDSKGEHDLAIIDDNKAIQPKHDNAEAYYKRGLASGKKGDYDSAIEYFTKAINLKPDDANAYDGRGISYGEKGDFDHAIADFTKAIQFKPHDANVYYNRGNTYIKTGDFDRAIVDFTQAIQLKPDDANVYYNRGISYGETGDFDHVPSQILPK